jgi:hypothetical protein
LNNSKVVVDQLTALERSNIVNNTPAILSAVRKEREEAAKNAIDDLLASNPAATIEQ